MTDELQPQQLELLNKLEAEVQQLESLPPAEIELDARGALALVTHMQIAATNPAPAVKHNPLLPSAIAAAKQIQCSFNPESAIYKVLELGWDKEPEVSDGVHQILRSSPCRPKKLRPPAPDFPDDYHHF